ncbi:MAG: DMT family transporter [Proteobacteria bacterium]|nr:DMT family transporter [Pseudomonadota bacterium]MDA1285153.1 DMT family transporter [Pseudomonadota bacterium]
MTAPVLMPSPGPTALPVEPAAVRDNLGGIVFALISVFGASLMSLGVRGVALELDSRMVVMARAGITSVLVIAALIVLPKLRRQLKFSRPWSHLFRGALIAVSTNLGFYTLAHVPLASATVLFFTAPIFATILGALVHGEKVGPRRIAASVAGFVGALVILRPGFEAFHPAMLAAIGSSALFAGALSLSRGLANADGAFSTYFSSVVITSIVTLPLALPVWAMPSGALTWFAVAVVVSMSALRGVADIQAYRLADAAILTPITYLRLVLIGIGAWLLFAEGIDGATWIGATIIVAATLYIARREAAFRKGTP